ncbi:MAG TPA: glycogen synthase [Patescibacteria group bacterium]
MPEVVLQIKNNNNTKGGKIKALFICTEVSPYSTVGGIGRVAHYLPTALTKLGHDIKVFSPKYGKIDQDSFKFEMVIKGLRVPAGDGQYLICNVKRHKLANGPEVFFLENHEYYEKRANQYGYSDDPIRWALLQRGALEFLRNIEWQPDLIHLNDWHTGLVPQMLKTWYKKSAKLSDMATLFTIHNLYFQGNFDHRFVSDLEYDDGRSEVPSMFDKRIHKINSMRRGILFSDVVNTVSPSYAKEILTEEYGEGLHPLLREVKEKLYGVLNGIDYDEFNPKTDDNVKFHYSKEDFKNRAKNKSVLQEEFNLPKDDKCIIAVSGRMDDQKGVDLIIEILPSILDLFDVQVVINGGGDHRFLAAFNDMQKKYPKQLGLNLSYNYNLPRLIFSGADMILIPSKFEPCGMVQMEAMRYGCIPVVRATGGLTDTVKDGKTGFVFEKYDHLALFATVVRAIETYKYPKVWSTLIKNAMNEDFSWTNSAKEYAALYQRAMDKRTKKG